ncbi:MAG TPA: hypothetical protein VFH42_05395, partial [Sporolactobacillaceae bacterium]|nr:hypothetical protein [Sporolactobacillaceae bacterium]
HIPLMVYHPKGKKGARSHELVQLVDLFPTIVETLEIDLPKKGMEGKFIVGKGHRKAWERLTISEYGLHGTSLLPILLEREPQRRRQAVFTGKFGDVIRVSDGKWAMYLSPEAGYPLYWYGRREPGRTFTGRHGIFDKEHERYEMVYKLPDYQNELYHLEKDPDETTNVIRAFPEEVRRLEALFIEWLVKINAPKEMQQRYKVSKG